MINKFILLTTIIATTFVTNTQVSYVPTKAAVVLAGSIVSSQNDTDTKKYKRKDCPVCKGKGWYISGDGIKRVNCGYCYDDTKKEETDLIRVKK
jgi:hypothetical protein